MKTAKARKPAKPKFLGYVAYEGPSLFDGKPIAVIVTKINQGSTNEKTGALVQTFIIRTDVDPVTALRDGSDASICGLCAHRPLLAAMTGEAPCYVQVAKSVLSVFNAYKRGRYTYASLEEIALALAGKKVRIGTYGDGAMAPVSMWQSILRYVAGKTGYSHQWAQAFFDAQAWAPLVMASVDSTEERIQAKALGMRTFRVSVGVSREKREAVCPASKEAGRKLTCADCLLCGGTSVNANDIVIADHAIGHAARAKRIQSITLAA